MRAWDDSVRNSHVSTLCPVVLCPYLCTSDLSAALKPTSRLRDFRQSDFREKLLLYVCCCLVSFVVLNTPCYCFMIMTSARGSQEEPRPPHLPVADENGVNTTGVAAEVTNIFVRSGKKVRPGTFGKIKVGQREYPKGPSVTKHEHQNCSDPISADPICPFPNLSATGTRENPGSRNSAAVLEHGSARGGEPVWFCGDAPTGCEPKGLALAGRVISRRGQAISEATAVQHMR